MFAIMFLIQKTYFIPLVFYTCGRAVVHILKWDQSSAKTTWACVSSSFRSQNAEDRLHHIPVLSSPTVWQV